MSTISTCEIQCDACDLEHNAPRLKKKRSPLYYVWVVCGMAGLEWRGDGLAELTPGVTLVNTFFTSYWLLWHCDCIQLGSN